MKSDEIHFQKKTYHELLKRLITLPYTQVLFISNKAREVRCVSFDATVRTFLFLIPKICVYYYYYP